VFAESGVPVRRLSALIEHLPSDAAAAAAQRGDPPGAWDRTEQLLALVLESQDLGHRVMVKLLASKPPSMGKPLRIEWPGRTATEAPKMKRSTPAEIAAFLGKARITVVPGGPDGS